jgi:hypothetical protein
MNELGFRFTPFGDRNSGGGAIHGSCVIINSQAARFKRWLLNPAAGMVE